MFFDMEQIEFMALPASMADALKKEEMVFIAGGTIGEGNSAVNNADGLCSGTNNASGLCNGVNNADGR